MSCRYRATRHTIGSGSSDCRKSRRLGSGRPTAVTLWRDSTRRSRSWWRSAADARRHGPAGSSSRSSTKRPVRFLPLELMPQRERILEDLAELKKAREELEAVTARIKTIERQVGNGQVKRLTFRIEGGRRFARRPNRLRCRVHDPVS